ncbi:MAG: putative bifunctional diguanylate cyclase/phosphodiesterase [Yoonia sp.]
MLRLSPDRLWAHYCLALAITLCLIFTTHAINRSIILHSISEPNGTMIAYLAQIQWLILALSVSVLLAEAVLIFLPAYLVVQSNLQSLRDQAKSLTKAKHQLQQMNCRLVHLSNHDRLTGLPNRGHLITLMKNQVNQLIADKHSFLIVGLDRFKSLNDSIGHETADALLIDIADTLKKCINDEDTIARVGGDEFAIITNEPADVMLRRLFAAIKTPFKVQGRTLKINASVGYLIMDRNRIDPVRILGDAGIALQVAKSKGADRAQLFTPELRENAGLQQILQLELPDAIRNGELEPWFQPQLRMADGSLHGVEVLARWHHPTRGVLTPDVFLLAAERSGMMIEMDHAIWKSAMTHAQSWQSLGLWRPVISLNAGPDTLSDPYLIERFLIVLRKCGLSPDQIIVEVLENTVIFGAGDMVTLNIDSLAECGIAIELDDFGTGYASLCRLTQLPLTGLKLDRSLVALLPEAGAGSIVRAILTLAAELGLRVVAEGIEDAQQANHLVQTGCKIGQGFGFVRPMPAQEFQAWLGKHASVPGLSGHIPMPLVKQA